MLEKLRNPGQVTNASPETWFRQEEDRLVSGFLASNCGNKVLAKVSRSRSVHVGQAMGLIFEELAIYYRSQNALESECVIGGVDLIGLIREVTKGVPGYHKGGYEPCFRFDRQVIPVPDAICISCHGRNPTITRVLEAKIVFKDLKSSTKRKMRNSRRRFLTFLSGYNGRPIVGGIASHFGLTDRLLVCSPQKLELEKLSIGENLRFSEETIPGVFVTKVPITRERLTDLTGNIFLSHGYNLIDRV